MEIDTGMGKYEGELVREHGHYVIKRECGDIVLADWQKPIISKTAWIIKGDGIIKESISIEEEMEFLRKQREAWSG